MFSRFRFVMPMHFADIEEHVNHIKVYIYTHLYIYIALLIPVQLEKSALCIECRSLYFILRRCLTNYLCNT